MRPWYLLILALLLLACTAPNAPGSTGQNAIANRTFLMGTSQWPPDFTLEAIEHMYEYKREHTDLFVYHQVAGVPWQEAYENAPFPKKLEDEWSYLRSKRHGKMYVALSPLAPMRTALAPAYTNENDNAPLAPPWSEYAYNDAHIKQAYLSYARRAIEYHKPDYLAIGIEVNILANNPPAWAQYLELHQYVYEQLKKEYPDLPIGVTIQYEHLQGLVEESKGRQAAHEQAVSQLLRYADFLGVSTYPYVVVERPVPHDYFDKIIALAGTKPVAIAETGYPSAEFRMYGMRYSFVPEDQRQYLELLLRNAAEHQFLFVVNWATTDFERLNAKLPAGPVQEAANYWMYTGLEYSDGTPKPASAVWDAYLQS